MLSYWKIPIKSEVIYLQKIEKILKHKRCYAFTVEYYSVS